MSVTINGTSGITQLAGTGTTTNDSASAGYVGEAISSAVNNISVGTTLNWTDATSIVLTAGDWDVNITALFTLNSATMSSAVNIGLSSTSGNSGTGLSQGDTQVDGAPPSSSSSTSLSIVGKRISLASTTTYYLKTYCTYSAGTPKFFGRISARRVR